MELNKENEEKPCGISKIPVLIRSLPKSGRPQPRLQQERSLKTVARGPLNTLAFQRVNQDLAGPSHVQTQCAPSSCKRLTAPAHGANERLANLSRLHNLGYLETKSEGLLNTLAFQRVNKDLAGPSHVQTQCAPSSCKRLTVPARGAYERLANLNRLYNLGSGETKSEGPLNTLAFQRVNKDLAGPSHVQTQCAPSSCKRLTGPAHGAIERLANLSRLNNFEHDETKSESKIPELTQVEKDKNISRGYVPLTDNSDLGIIGFNRCLAGPSSVSKDCSLRNNSGISKIDGIVPAFKKDEILASSLNKTSFFTPPLELRSLKKVKRSLKRPHSRGLLSLPPFDIDLTNDIQKVVVDESEKTTNDGDLSVCIDKLTRCYTNDAIVYLLDTERKPCSSNIPDDCRSIIVNYIMEVNGATGQSAIVQLATWYIDKICSHSRVWHQLRLTAAACLWIASKFYGGAIHGMRIVKRSSNAFTIKDLALAERRVLNELKFPIHPVIPHDFIPYLSWWCDPEADIIEPAATFLCLCGLTVSKSIGEEYASVVAVASVRTALVLLRMEERVKRLEDCPVYHSATKKADISAVCTVLRESLHKMAAANYEYKKALIHYSQKPYCIAPKLAYANYYD